MQVAVPASTGRLRTRSLRATASTPGPRLAEIALHRCAGAADGSDVEAAVELAERAADWALERDAYEQAVTLLTRALKLLTDADVERRRRITRARAIAYARLTHVLWDS